MSFSAEVKEELAEHIGSARHCMLAELAAIMVTATQLVQDNGGTKLLLKSENELLIKKCFTLLKKTITMVSVRFDAPFSHEKGKEGIVLGENVQEILQAVKWQDTASGMTKISPLLLKSACCKRAALRGLFLANGSMSNPKSGYHLEFVCSDIELANQIVELISDFELEAKIAKRGKYHVVYMKEGAAIVDLLNIMEAHVSLMNLENLRILKDISNTVNRRVNCEAANIMKTVSAAGKQVADIRLIEQTRGLQSLPVNLQEAANIRLTYPEMTLSELAAAMNPPIGKSGMNHRLRKLSDIAEEIRGSSLCE